MNIEETTPWSEHYPHVRVNGPLHGSPRVLDAVTALYERAAYVDADLPYFVADASTRGTVAALNELFFLPRGRRLRWFAQKGKYLTFPGYYPIGISWETSPTARQECCAWYGWFRPVAAGDRGVAPDADEVGLYIDPIVYAPTDHTDASADPRIGTAHNFLYFLVPGDCAFTWSGDQAAIRTVDGQSPDSQNQWCIPYSDNGAPQASRRVVLNWGGTEDFQDAAGAPYTPVKLPDHYSGDSDATFIPDRATPFQHAVVDPYFLTRIKNRLTLLDQPYYSGSVQGGMYYPTVEAFAQNAAPGELGATGGLTASDGSLCTDLEFSYFKNTNGPGKPPSWESVLSSVSEADARPRVGTNSGSEFGCDLECTVGTSHDSLSNTHTARAALRCVIRRPILLYKPLFPADDRLFENGVFRGMNLLASIVEQAPTGFPRLLFDRATVVKFEQTQPNLGWLIDTARALANPSGTLFASNPVHWVDATPPNPVLAFGGAVGREGVGVATQYLARLGECGASKTRPVIVYTPPLSVSDVLTRLKTAAMYGAVTYAHASRTRETRTEARAGVSIGYTLHRLVERHHAPAWKHTL